MSPSSRPFPMAGALGMLAVIAKSAAAWTRAAVAQERGRALAELPRVVELVG